MSSPQKRRMKKVISVSRRTDIPAFYLQWLITCLQRGYALVKNPYSGIAYKVDLKPQMVHTLVLWSKNFAHFLKQKEFFNDYHLFFNFTINHCSLLEPRIPSIEERLAQAKELANIYGAERIQWRFDPIMLWNNGKENNTKFFSKIARFLAALGIYRCIFSFVHYYEKVKKRLQKMGFNYYIPTKEEKCEIIEQLITIGHDYGLKMLACCDDELLEVPGVEKAHCIDGNLLQRLNGELCSIAKDRGQRKKCGCTKSIDIGSYELQPCYHGCIYCYANPAL